MTPADLTRIAAEVMIREGAAPDSGIHSWRCEYPDMYGPCDCVEALAAEVVTALLDEAATREEWQAACVEPGHTCHPTICHDEREARWHAETPGRVAQRRTVTTIPPLVGDWEQVEP